MSLTVGFPGVERLRLVSDTTLLDKAGANTFVETSKCLARGSEAWVIHKNTWDVWNGMGGMKSATSHHVRLHATDDKGQDLGWIRWEYTNDSPHKHRLTPAKCEDMPSEVRSAVTQLYLDQDGQSNWEALLASKSLSEIRDMNYSDTRKLFTEHAIKRHYGARSSYLNEVEFMAASGIGSKAIQLQCARSEEGVSVTLRTLSGEELATLTLSASEKTVGALREAVNDALADVVHLPRVALHDGRMLADLGHAETIETVFDLCL
jgi:hypothetical protein